MPTEEKVYMSSAARIDAQQLVDKLGDFLKQDADRGTLAGSIPELRETLLQFAGTLREFEANLNDCVGCGDQATRCVRDKEHNEFFVCSSVSCAERTRPAERYDLSAAGWVSFCSQQLPAKRVRWDTEVLGFNEACDDEDLDDSLLEQYDDVNDNEEQGADTLVEGYDYVDNTQQERRDTGTLVEGYDYVDNDIERESEEHTEEEEDDIGDGYGTL